MPNPGANQAGGRQHRHECRWLAGRPFPCGSVTAGDEMSSRPRVIAVGLGPAGPEHTTPAATDGTLGALRSPFCARPGTRPRSPWSGDARTSSLSTTATRAGATFEEVYRSIAAIVVAAAVETGRVAYAVPGSPAVAERTVELSRAEPSVDLEIVPGISFCDLAWARLGIDPVEAGVRLVDAESFAVQAAGDAGPLLVGQCWYKDVLSEVKLSFDSRPGAGRPAPPSRAWPTRSSSRSPGPRSTGPSKPIT